MTVVVSGPRPAPPLIRSNDVFILGSGFSKSISPVLIPTELGERVGPGFRRALASITCQRRPQPPCGPAACRAETSRVGSRT
jgi:hypothetical protein